jgi:tetratricopeptide (TPR) repeat protein
MYRLIPLALLFAAACDSKAPAPAPATNAPPPPATTKALFEEAERERTPEAYQRVLEATAGDPVYRTAARWRISLMRGDPDPEVAKGLESSEPLAKALKALVRLVDGVHARGAWEPLAPRILKEAYEKAFPECAAFKTDWAGLIRLPDGETQSICEGLAGAPDWPLAAGVRAALEGRDIPPAGKEGLLSILTALRLPPSEAMATLESAGGPDQGILRQAQAQLLAAEGKFSDAVSRMALSPVALLRSASLVAASKPKDALESLGERTSAFANALRAAAQLQLGTDDALKQLESIPEAGSIPYVKFERGLRRLAAGAPDAIRDFEAARASAGAFTEAWYGLACWHLRANVEADALASVDLAKLDPEFALAVQEARGFALLARGDDEKGAEALLATAEKRPTRETFQKFAPLFRGNRDWKALQELGKILARGLPQDPEPWIARVEALFWLKDYQAAVEMVTFALGQKVDPKRILKWRALSFEELGKVDEALADWSRLAELSSTEGDAFSHRAWMLALKTQWDRVKENAEQGVSRGSNSWANALARFALAAEALYGPAPEDAEADPESRKESALKQLNLAVKTGAVEPSDLEKVRPTFASLPDDEWKKVVEAAAAKQKEQKDELKLGSFLGVMLDHGGGSVAVTGTYRKTGARAAGLVPGDIILEVEGRRVNYVSDVSSIVAGREPGAEVKVKFQREIRPGLKLRQERSIALSRRDIFEQE